MIVVESDADVMVKKYGNEVFLQETLWKERKLDLEMMEGAAAQGSHRRAQDGYGNKNDACQGYFALSCSACTCKFCGWCLQDCGDHDAHPHVLQCAQVPRGADAFFPQMPTVPLAFEKIHTERCRERTKSYINNEVEEEIRKKVRQQVKSITKP
jgi:hypothetical protein